MHFIKYTSNLKLSGDVTYKGSSNEVITYDVTA